MKQADDFIRPSNLWRLALCEGAALMSAEAENQGAHIAAGPEADVGTSVHSEAEIGAQMVVAGVCDWVGAADISRERALLSGIDSWSARCVHDCLVFYGELVKKYDVSPENILVEYPLDMSGCGMNRKGTADLVLVVPGKLVVICDLKAGFLDQGDADDHDQMSSYASAAAVEFQCDDVHTYLFQPRAEKQYRSSAARYDAKQLREAATWARAVCSLARKPNPPLCAGFLQCNTCPAMRRCAEAKEFIVNAQEAIAIMGVPLTPACWGETIGAAKLAEKWGSEWKKAGKEHMKTGGIATGFKLTDGRNMRACDNVAIAMRKLEAGGYGHELLTAITISVAKLSPEAVNCISENISSKRCEQSIAPDKRSGK